MGRGARANALGDQSGEEEETCANCGSVAGNGNHQRRKDRAIARVQTSGDGMDVETDTLFIGNIDAGATEEVLGAAFAAHGTVVNVRIPTDS